jgi:hypothetical protein
MNSTLGRSAAVELYHTMACEITSSFWMIAAQMQIRQAMPEEKP